MAWRNHGSTFPVTRRGRGLSGMNMDAIKKPVHNVVPRQFGTELPSNIMDNQIRLRMAKKRTFKQLEGKEEEKFNAQPTKKRRYNLRSQANHQKEIGKENINNKGKGRNQQIQRKMEEPEADLASDEDIDLAPYRTRNVRKREETKRDIQKQQTQQQPQQQQYGDKGQKNQHKNQKQSQQPVRRSVRLKNKRARNLEQDLEAKQPEDIDPIVDRKMMDCDEENKMNDLLVPEYSRGIVEWYRECEDAPFQRKLIQKEYISTRFQPDLNDSMRSILLDWLFNVHRRFQLCDRTLYLATYILDGYLSLVPVKRSQLQLIGCTALWISSKYNEIYAPEATDFVFISDHSFEVEDLFSTEVAILVRLQFRFADIVTPIHFLERYLQIAAHPLFMKYNARGTAKARKDGQRYISLVTNLAQYFGHLVLFDSKVVSTRKPSLIAAAALCFTVLSISLYSRWPEFLENSTGYSYKELRPTMRRMNELRKIAVIEGNGKMNSLRKMHKSVTKWLNRLNIEDTINNKN